MPVTLDISPELMETARVRRAYVLAVPECQSTVAQMQPLVSETWNKLKKPSAAPSCITVWRWKARYLRAGGDIKALLPQYHSRGNKKSRHDQLLKDIVQQAIDEAFMTRERRTVQDTLDRAIFLTRRENELRPADMSLKIPTRRLVQRLIDQIPRLRSEVPDLAGNQPSSSLGLSRHTARRSPLLSGPK